jgi:hypothetical protein
MNFLIANLIFKLGFILENNYKLSFYLLEFIPDFKSYFEIFKNHDAYRLTFLYKVHHLN